MKKRLTIDIQDLEERLAEQGSEGQPLASVIRSILRVGLGTLETAREMHLPALPINPEPEEMEQWIRMVAKLIASGTVDLVEAGSVEQLVEQKYFYLRKRVTWTKELEEIKNNKRSCTDAEIIKIAALLGIDPEVLLDLKQEREKTANGH